VTEIVAAENQDSGVSRNFPELQFTAVAVDHEYYVEFTVYEIAGWTDGERKGIYDVPLWQKAGSHMSPDPVDSLRDAEVYLHGSVKWDGCSNWWFDEQERGCVLHGCSKDDLLRIGNIMAACWDWTSEICPTWEG
jgi:hypothetical protein